MPFSNRKRCRVRHFRSAHVPQLRRCVRVGMLNPLGFITNERVAGVCVCIPVTSEMDASGRRLDFQQEQF